MAMATLGELLDRFEQSAAVKPATKAAYRQAIGSLREHFGEKAPLKSITAVHADEWYKSLMRTSIWQSATRSQSAATVTTNAAQKAAHLWRKMRRSIRPRVIAPIRAMMREYLVL